MLSRQAPAEFLGKRGATRRAFWGKPARSGSQLVEAAAAEEVAVTTLVHVVGWCVQAHGAEQVVGDVSSPLSLHFFMGGGFCSETFLYTHTSSSRPLVVIAGVLAAALM